MHLLSILSARNFNMSPILQTLKTSGSCFWCREMNFISIFDSSRARAGAPWPHDRRYISDPALSICKAFRSYNFTKTLKTLQTFPGKPRCSRISKTKKKEIKCQLLKIILIMLILFLRRRSLYAVRLHHIQAALIYATRVPMPASTNNVELWYSIDEVNLADKRAAIA